MLTITAPMSSRVLVATSDNDMNGGREIPQKDILLNVLIDDFPEKVIKFGTYPKRKLFIRIRHPYLGTIDERWTKMK